MRNWSTKILRLVLDSNEYILFFGPEKSQPVVELFSRLAARPSHIRIFISRRIVRETARNLSEGEMGRCHRFWHSLGIAVDEETIIPATSLATYLKRGLKFGDAWIAAYAESVGTDILISENRHFLKLSDPLPFRVMDAAEFLKRQTVI